MIRQQFVDILPGVHTIKLDYVSVDNSDSRRMVRKLSEPIVMEFEFTAGYFYRIPPFPRTAARERASRSFRAGKYRGGEE